MGPEPPELALLALELEEAELLGLPGGEERGEPGGALPGPLAAWASGICLHNGPYRYSCNR